MSQDLLIIEASRSKPSPSIVQVKFKKKVNLTLKEAMKAQKGDRGVSVI